MRRLCVILLVLGAALISQAESPALRWVRSIPLGDVEGRIDHMAVDAAGQRLFVAALGNDSIEIIDLRKGTSIRSLRHIREPQGIVYIAASGRFVVASGQDDACNVYDGKSFAAVGRVPHLDDADNLRYDASAQRVYVGYGDGAIGILDPVAGKVLGDVKLQAHPEAFELEPKSGRIFVNVPGARQIAVIDRAKAGVVATWPVDEVRGNFPMALDERHGHLFVGCREPQCLLVLDAGTGRCIARLNIDGDSDDIFYNDRRRLLYISCGDGFVDVLSVADAGTCVLEQRIPTAAGARTSLFVPELQRLFVAVPHRGKQRAEIREYDTSLPPVKNQ